MPEGSDQLMKRRTRRARQVLPFRMPRVSDGWPGRYWFAALGIFVLLYVSWLIWQWIPFGQNLVGEVILLPVNATAAVMAWQASRNVGDRSRLVLAWRLISLGLYGQLA